MWARNNPVVADSFVCCQPEEFHIRQRNEGGAVFEASGVAKCFGSLGGIGKSRVFYIWIWNNLSYRGIFLADDWVISKCGCGRAKWTTCK
jgi:hypothetical protein